MREMVSHRLADRRGAARRSPSRCGPGRARSRSSCRWRRKVPLSARMKAAVLHGREDVRIERSRVPRLEDGEILLRTRVALTCGTDVKVFRRGYHARMIRPAGRVRPRGGGRRRGGRRRGRGPRARDARSWSRTRRPAASAATAAPAAQSLCDDLLFWNGAYAEFARIPARIVRHNVLPARGRARLPRGGDGRAARVRRAGDRGERRPARGQTVAVLGAGPIGLMLVRLAAAARRAPSSRWAATRAASQRARALGAERDDRRRAGRGPRRAGSVRSGRTGTGRTW